MSDFKNPSNGSGGGAWGDITGTLSNQTDLQAALDAKAATTSLPTTITWTPSHTWPTNTATTQQAYVQTIGSRVWMGGTLKIALTGVPDNAVLQLTMPAAYTIDTLYPTNIPLCTAWMHDTSSTLGYLCPGYKLSSTVIEFVTLTVLSTLGNPLVDNAQVNRTVPFTWANTDTVLINFGFWVVPV